MVWRLFLFFLPFVFCDIYLDIENYATQNYLDNRFEERVAQTDILPDLLSPSISWTLAENTKTQLSKILIRKGWEPIYPLGLMRAAIALLDDELVLHVIPFLDPFVPAEMNCLVDSTKMIVKHFHDGPDVAEKELRTIWTDFYVPLISMNSALATPIQLSFAKVAVKLELKYLFDLVNGKVHLDVLLMVAKKGLVEWLKGDPKQLCDPVVYELCRYFGKQNVPLSFFGVLEPLHMRNCGIGYMAGQTEVGHRKTLPRRLAEGYFLGLVHGQHYDLLQNYSWNIYAPFLSKMLRISIETCDKSMLDNVPEIQSILSQTDWKTIFDHAVTHNCQLYYIRSERYASDHQWHRTVQMGIQHKNQDFITIGFRYLTLEDKFESIQEMIDNNLDILALELARFFSLNKNLIDAGIRNRNYAVIMRAKDLKSQSSFSEKRPLGKLDEPLPLIGMSAMSRPIHDEWPRYYGPWKTKHEKGSQEEELDQQKVSTKGIVGFKNLGNTCFINSALQVLLSVDDFGDKLLSLPKIQSNETLILEELIRLVTSARNTERPENYQNIKSLRSAIVSVLTDYNDYQ
jgi:hypothetical protein